MRGTSSSVRRLCCWRSAAKVTLASVDAEGFPPRDALEGTPDKGCSEIVIGLRYGSRFGQGRRLRAQPRAGLCYTAWGDSVAPARRGRMRV